MTNPETKSRSGCLAVAIIAAVLLLPPAYLLSTGPAFWMMRNDYLPRFAYNYYIWPAELAMERCPPLRDAMFWYTDQFAT